VDESRERLLGDRVALARGLAALGVAVHASDTVYVLADLGARSATELRSRLFRRHGILIRDATSFGLPHHVRLAARPEAERRRLFDALARELHT
jgi:histidinol-phosphate/aromatic aminotransferase/cobyric acid decarboxylase-like protein